MRSYQGPPSVFCPCRSSVPISPREGYEGKDEFDARIVSGKWMTSGLDRAGIREKFWRKGETLGRDSMFIKIELVSHEDASWIQYLLCKRTHAWKNVTRRSELLSVPEKKSNRMRERRLLLNGN